MTPPERPWLTVVMPVYNGAATLARALASLDGQADGVEVLVVDQASRDDSAAIAKGFAGRLDLRLIDGSGNTTWIANTNMGFAAARADLVTMLHQDDQWRPGRLTALRAAVARHPQAAFWVHGARYIDAADRPLGRFAPPFGPRPALIPSARAVEALLVQDTIALPAVLFRKADVQAQGLDPALWYTADWDLWLRLARRGDVSWMPEDLVDFRIHAGSLTVTGSRDAASFRQQLATPIARHIDAVPVARRARLRALAEVSADLNATLAAAYHGLPYRLLPLIRRLVALGPCAWWVFWRDSRILARVLPRLRAILFRR